MLVLTLHEWKDYECCERRTCGALCKRHGAGGGLWRWLFSFCWWRGWGPRGDSKILRVLAEYLRKFLVHFWIESKLLGEDVPEILHVGKIAALVVIEDALEDIGFAKRLFLQRQFGGGVWRVDDFSPKLFEGDLWGFAGSSRR